MNLADFPTSESAKRMLGTVTPGWYERSYVGKWLYQVMGEEIDDAKRLFEELRAQTAVDTATWSLCYWEQKYNIPINESLSIEKRRQQVKERQCRRRSMNPERLRQLVEFITGRPAEILENVAPYTFEVKVYVLTSSSNINEELLRNKLDEMKPSHMAYRITTERPITANMYFGGFAQDAEIITIRQVN